MFRKALVALSLCMPAAAHAKWREASTDHFVIYAEQSPKELHEFASKLERYDKALRFIRNVPDAPVGKANRLTVYVVRNLAAVQKLYGEGARRGDHQVAGFYMPRATGSIAITPESAGSGSRFDTNAETVLLHEYAHHFMLRHFPGAFSSWFIEGFAEFHSTAKFEKDGSVGVGLPALHRLSSLYHLPAIPMEAMMANAVSSLSPTARESLYARGWLLTHYLTFHPRRKGQLVTYIAKLNEGVGALEAARAAFGDLKTLDREIDGYLKGRRMNSWVLDAEKVRIGPIHVRELTPGEDAVMDLKIRSRRGVNEAQAKALLPEMRRAAAPFPKDVGAQTTLAEAEYDAGNYAEAEAAADRALAVDPKSVDALIYKSMAKAAVAVAAKKTDEATWKDVRKWIVAANRADPDDPEPLILFYSSFAAQQKEPTANATMGLTTAMMAAPEDQDLRMKVAFQMLKDDKAKDARTALAPIAFNPHGGEMAQAASAILTKLDKEGTKAALAFISEAAKEAEGKDGKKDASGK